MAFFDKKSQIVHARHPKDTEIEAVNMVLNEANGRANRIKLGYFSDGKTLTLDTFAAEFHNYESRDNFLSTEITSFNFFHFGYLTPAY